ncbi:putative addiction module component, TIGR02574 family [Nitrosomonas marina]|uniref:Putative addiction module component, TIGR02574 family n=1 Tax=Nitrosomonas marina TaxID=917 RepID=A0A1I0FZW1_9PROT|nr:addiction module protein [Nitrosomonas marina]SET63095.1 putative addiction module component, TIGR02574 family [Nitrosomonas marina]
MQTLPTNIQELPVDERIKLVEDIWDSIAADQSVLPLTVDQKKALDQRLDAYEVDQLKGREATELIAEIKKQL